MRRKLELGPILPRSPNEPKNVEFIAFATLAVAGSTAIVVFLVKPANTPRIAEASAAVIQEGTPKSMTVEVSGENGDELTHSMVAGPAHRQPGGTAPNLNHNPETDFHGSESSSFRVNDVEADSDVPAVSIEVKSATDNSDLKTHSLTVTAVDRVRHGLLAGSSVVRTQ